MFDTLQDRLQSAFRGLRGKGRLTEADIDATMREIRIALLEADVNLAVVKEFIANVKQQATGLELSKALNPAQQVIKIVNDELVDILGGQTRTVRFSKTPPTVIMLAGLQGAGKTTLAGKLANWLKSEGHSPLLVAADLQRPNAVNQLQIVGERAGVHVFAPEPGNGVGDPIRVARESIAWANQRLHDVVIVDTAGRLGIDAELMQQAADIKAAVNPDEVLFVVDAMIGQDAVNTALAFQEGVGFDGVVLTKLDGDARGGAALSIAKVIGRPIMFASSGEGLKDFDVFHPERMASRILDMGDVMTLIEQAEKNFDAEQSKLAAEKLLAGKGQFTLGDFLVQMQQMRKMGPLTKIFGMLPGMGQMKEQLANLDEKEIDRVEAIIYSMTPAERADVAILNGSRRKRIAAGSGVEVRDVNNLVNRFVEARKMMQSMAGGMRKGGKMPGMPGLPPEMMEGMEGMGEMPGIGGGRPQNQQKAPTNPLAMQPRNGRKNKKGGRGKTGPARQTPAPQDGGAFGAPVPDAAQLEAQMGDFTLDKSLQKLLRQQGRGN